MRQLAKSVDERIVKSVLNVAFQRLKLLEADGVNRIYRPFAVENRVNVVAARFLKIHQIYQISRAVQLVRIFRVYQQSVFASEIAV